MDELPMPRPCHRSLLAPADRGLAQAHPSMGHRMDIPVPHPMEASHVMVLWRSPIGNHPERQRSLRSLKEVCRDLSFAKKLLNL